MVHAGTRSANRGYDGADSVYKAMLSASPPPPEAASQPDSVNEGSAGEVK
jgi:hypothetical protein